MATGKKNAAEKQPQTDSAVVYDKVWEFPKGNLHVIMDISKLLGRMERYKDQLVYVRDLPFNPQNIDVGDPLLQWIGENMPFVTTEKVKQTAITHYLKMMSATEVDAFLLAVTLDNIFANPPLPYEDEVDEEELPGIVTMPTYKKNIENPVEARLKQIMDIMVSNQQMALQLMNAIENSMVRIKQMGAKVDEDGFPG